MKHLYLFAITCFMLSIKMIAQNSTSSLIKDWLSEEGSLYYGCSYVRSFQGDKNAMLYYSIKEKEEVEGTKYSRMFINVIELSELKSGLHEMLYIDEEFPGTCTDVLLIRQNDGKVYCQSEDGTQEWLILDFSLKTGDTFVNSFGERFTVKETGLADNHKKLLMISEDGMQEDTWEEGIGSMRWGFLPDYVVKTLKYFQDVEEPLYMYLWAAGAPDFFVSQEIKDEFFILQPFEDNLVENMTYEELNQTETWLTFSFIGDCLWIQGYYPLTLYPSFIAASITGTHIDISIHQVATLNMSMGRHVAKIDVRIPGFRAGTYEVGLSGKESQTVVCQGMNGTYIPIVINKSSKGKLFDLQGRRLSTKPSRGIYIENGKKRMVK